MLGTNHSLYLNRKVLILLCPKNKKSNSALCLMQCRLENVLQSELGFIAQVLFTVQGPETATFCSTALSTVLNLRMIFPIG